MDWTCTCGRVWPELSPRCSSCGEPRPAAPASVEEEIVETVEVETVPEELVDAEPLVDAPLIGDETVVALAIYPPPRLTEGMLAVYGEELDLGIYDARRRLEVPFPHVVGTGRFDEVEATAKRLRDTGLPSRIVLADELFSVLTPRKLTKVDGITPGEVLGEGPDGNGIGVPIKRWSIDLARDRLVVVGSWMVQAGLADKKLRFVHVWYRGEDRPFELVEKHMKQFVLGPKQKPSARANFDLVLDALSGPGAVRDDSLFTDGQRVPTTVVSVAADVKCSIGVADVISRLLWNKWSGES